MGKKRSHNDSLTDSDRLLGKQAEREEKELGRNPPGFISPSQEPLWDRAKKAADKSGPHKERFAVITHIFKKMGGTIK